MSTSAPGRDAPAQEPTTSQICRILATGLTKRYGLRTVLRSVDLSINSGECVALFGPNGAGKTTLLRVLSTLTRSAGGSLQINDLDAESDANEVRSQIGVVAHQPYVYDSLTARENLQFFGRMYDVEHLSDRIRAVLSTVELSDRADDRVETFSRGMLQRIALARAMLHSPSVLLLDEPDAGLDPAGVRVLEMILSDHCNSGGSALMTTHDLAFGLRASHRAMVMVSGRILVDLVSSEIDPATIEAMMGKPGA